MSIFNKATERQPVRFFYYFRRNISRDQGAQKTKFITNTSLSQCLTERNQTHTFDLRSMILSLYISFTIIVSEDRTRHFRPTSIDIICKHIYMLASLIELPPPTTDKMWRTTDCCALPVQTCTTKLICTFEHRFHLRWGIRPPTAKREHARSGSAEIARRPSGRG